MEAGASTPDIASGGRVKTSSCNEGLGKYNHLVANMFILNNVRRMSKVLKDMQGKGTFEITEEVLAGLPPYRTIHINRFGDYLMDLERAVEPMNTRIRFGFKKRAAKAA